MPNSLVNDAKANCLALFYAVRGNRRLSNTLLILSMVLCQAGMAAAANFTAVTDTLNDARRNHTATLLKDGTVLFTGGGVSAVSALASAEVFDPGPQVRTLFTNMSAARTNHTATRLLPPYDNQVLIVGGNGGGGDSVGSAEIYNSDTGGFTKAVSSPAPREYHTATLLQDGRVLIAGGRSQSSGSTAVSTAEIYDPATGLFAATGSMHIARYGHTATLLVDGTVLIAGGFTGSDNTNSAEIYNPGSGTFIVTGNMQKVRRYHTATRLNDNTVLIAGGQNGTTLDTAEIYTPNTPAPASGGFAYVSSGLPTLTPERQNHQMTILDSGAVIITGGQNFSSPALISSEQYTFGNFGNFLDMNHARTSHTATLLADGVSVLIAGGYDGTSSLNSLEIYNSQYLSVRPLSYTFADTVVNASRSNNQFVISNTYSSGFALTITPSDSSFTTSGCASVPANGSCTLTVTFTPTATGLSQGMLVISESTLGEIVYSTVSGTGINPGYLLTVSPSGGGSGTVSSTPAGINNCPLGPGSPNCSATIAGGPVTLTPSPSAGLSPSSPNASYFSGWSGVTCVGSIGNNCPFTLGAPTTVTASFNLYPVTIGKTTYYATLQDAYNGAGAGDQILAASGYNTGQDLNLNRNIAAVLHGGYDGPFNSAPVTDYSNVTGTLTVLQGAATIDHLIVK